MFKLMIVAPPCAAIGLMLCSGSIAFAQGRASSADNELLMAGEQTVVTATKTRQRISDVPSAVTVITAEQIEASGATGLLDLLRYVPGVDVSQQGNTVANVSIRGLNSQLANKLLVMIDGHSIYKDFLGIVSWATHPLLLCSIKRIEIVRGPGSALYGANAFCGVINIITKAPAELAASPVKTSVRSLVGERDTQQVELLAAAGNPKGWSAAIGGAYSHSDGFGSKGKWDLHDRSSIPTVTLDVQRAMKRGALRLTLDNTEPVWDFYQGVDLANTHTHDSYATLVYGEDKVKDPITARFTGHFLKETSSGSNYGNTQTYELEVQQARTLSSRSHLVYGGSVRSIDFSSSITGAKTYHQNLYAGYLQDEWQIAAHTSLFTGLRLDNNSIYGMQFTPRISLIRHLPARQSVRLSYGEAFRAPTLLDSYWNQLVPLGPQVNVLFTGNPHLKPERLTSFEVGYRKEWADGYLAANAYINRASNLIGTVPTAFFPSPPYPAYTPSNIQPINSGSIDVAGFELEGEAILTHHIKAGFNYAYEDEQTTNRTLLQLSSPKHKINLSLQAKLSTLWDLFVGAHFVGGQIMANDTGKGSINAYTRFDARLGYRLRGGLRPLTLSLAATNLFDDKHLEYPYLNSPATPRESAPQRRTLSMSLQGKF